MKGEGYPSLENRCPILSRPTRGEGAGDSMASALSVSAQDFVRPNEKHRRPSSANFSLNEESRTSVPNMHGRFSQAPYRYRNKGESPVEAPGIIPPCCTFPKEKIVDRSPLLIFSPILSGRETAEIDGINPPEDALRVWRHADPLPG